MLATAWLTLVVTDLALIAQLQLGRWGLDSLAPNQAAGMIPVGVGGVGTGRLVRDWATHTATAALAGVVLAQGGAWVTLTLSSATPTSPTVHYVPVSLLRFLERALVASLAPASTTLVTWTIIVSGAAQWDSGTWEAVGIPLLVVALQAAGVPLWAPPRKPSFGPIHSSSSSSSSSSSPHSSSSSRSLLGKERWLLAVVTVTLPFVTAIVLWRGMGFRGVVNAALLAPLAWLPLAWFLWAELHGNSHKAGVYWRVVAGVSGASVTLLAVESVALGSLATLWVWPAPWRHVAVWSATALLGTALGTFLWGLGDAVFMTLGAMGVGILGAAAGLPWWSLGSLGTVVVMKGEQRRWAAVGVVSLFVGLVLRTVAVIPLTGLGVVLPWGIWLSASLAVGVPVLLGTRRFSGETPNDKPAEGATIPQREGWCLAYVTLATLVEALLYLHAVDGVRWYPPLFGFLTALGTLGWSWPRHPLTRRVVVALAIAKASLLAEPSLGSFLGAFFVAITAAPLFAFLAPHSPHSPYSLTRGEAVKHAVAVAMALAVTRETVTGVALRLLLGTADLSATQLWSATVALWLAIIAPALTTSLSQRSRGMAVLFPLGALVMTLVAWRPMALHAVQWLSLAAVAVSALMGQWRVVAMAASGVIVPTVIPTEAAHWSLPWLSAAVGVTWVRTLADIARPRGRVAVAMDSAAWLTLWTGVWLVTPPAERLIPWGLLAAQLLLVALQVKLVTSTPFPHTHTFVAATGNWIPLMGNISCIAAFVLSVGVNVSFLGGSQASVIVLSPILLLLSQDSYLCTGLTEKTRYFPMLLGVTFYLLMSVVGSLLANYVSLLRSVGLSPAPPIEWLWLALLLPLLYRFHQFMWNFAHQNTLTLALIFPLSLPPILFTSLAPIRLLGIIGTIGGALQFVVSRRIQSRGKEIL